MPSLSYPAVYHLIERMRAAGGAALAQSLHPYHGPDRLPVTPT